MTSQRATLFAAAALCLGLSGCEQPATTEAVAAKVEGETISQAELDRAVARLGPKNATEAAQARSKVLEALVDQYLVSHAARNAKLDKAPEVALAMQQAQRQVLVEAYMEHLFKNLPRPADAEIRDYYARHPELFAQRKLYRVQELELQMAPARVAEVEAQLKRSRGLAEFADWLGTQGIDSKGGVTVRPAERIPAAILAQLVGMKDGQAVIVPTGDDRVSVLQLQGSQLQPVTLEQAREAIERIVLSEKRKTLLEAEVMKLRSSGRVEYASGLAPAASSGKAPL